MTSYARRHTRRIWVRRAERVLACLALGLVGYITVMYLITADSDTLAYGLIGRIL